MPMKIRSSLCSAAFSGALWLTMLAGPASADFISPGMMDTSGQIYSQGMVAESGPWGGRDLQPGHDDVDRRHLQSGNGDRDRRGNEFLAAQPGVHRHRPQLHRQRHKHADSLRFANQSTRKPGFAAHWRHFYRERRPDPGTCQPGVARPGSPLVGLGAVSAQRNVKKTGTLRHSKRMRTARLRAAALLGTLSFATRASAVEPGSRTDGLRRGPAGIRASGGNTILPGYRRRRSG